ncbi:MAG TPA: PAS domain S-box protein [Candidatus Sulfotelmatobacter sp.]|nr:PAS domain S-box protein [Candidatus Sulfotelmatobacter sp.]
MLPAGKFPRFAIGVALLLALLLVLDIEFVRPIPFRLLASNSLDLVMVALATLCSFLAARRSSGLARQVWALLAVALALQTLALAISSYYQSFVPGAWQNPWPSDVLFFVWAAPVFMIFLPRSEEQASAIDSLRIFDFAQIGIVAVTIYLYFFYSPSRWLSQGPALLRQILLLYIARDLLLSIGFFFRSRASLPSWLRSLSLALAFVFLTAVLSDADYLFTLGTSQGAASWGDLVYMLPYFLVTLFAVSWKQKDSVPLPAPSSPSGSFLSSQAFPIVMPLCVIFMAKAIAREHVTLAWLAVTASVLCSSVSLILTNRRQRHIADDLLNTEKALRSSEQMLSTAFRSSPDSFSINVFPNGPYLEVNEGFTRLTGYTREETLNKTPSQMNLWIDPAERARILAGLNQAGDVRDAEFHFRTKTGQIRVGHMSACLVELDARPCTLVVVRDVTARKEAEDILRTSEERLRTLVRDLHVAVVLQRPDGLIEFANAAAYRMFGIPQGTATGKSPADFGIELVTEDGKGLSVENHPVRVVLRTRTPIENNTIGVRHPGSPGKTLWVFGNVVPQFDAHGNVIRVITSFSDITEMKNAERAIHQLSTQLLKLQDEERRRLGRELHDGLAQTVLAINLSLAQLRQSFKPTDEAATHALEKARSLTHQMSREIRTLSYLLHPPLLDDLGLISALNEYAHGFSERSGIDTQLLLLSDFDRLPQPVELALFRVVQESLANIQRHSGSAAARIRLRQENSLVTLEVVDFGHGMKIPANGSPQPKEARLGVGIPGMRERMAQLGGHLDFISGANGTTVRATISLSSLSSSETEHDASSHPHRR